MKLRKHKQALAKCADDLASRRHDTFYREDCSDRHYFYSLQVLIGRPSNCSAWPGIPKEMLSHKAAPEGISFVEHPSPKSRYHCLFALHSLRGDSLVSIIPSTFAAPENSSPGKLSN